MVQKREINAARGKKNIKTLRIIGGYFRGRKIKHPDVEEVRPTKDRIREAVFNIIAGAIPGSSVLDIFAGSGAYGLEALSRGAERAVFVEKSDGCCAAIEENIDMLGLKTRTRVIAGDAFSSIKEFGGNKEKFGIVFVDPPYDKDLAKKTLIMINHYDIVLPSGIVIVETRRGQDVPESQGNICVYKQRTYGDILISLYQRK